MEHHVTEWPRKRKPKVKKEYIIKNAKIRGIEHTNHVGKFVPQRETGDDCRCSRFHCFEKVSIVKRQQILEAFNNMKDKNEQDSHLCGLISIKMISRRRARNLQEECQKPHTASYSYKLRIEGIDIPICLKAFLSVHGISKHRVARLQQSLTMTGQSPKDKRGCHFNRPNKVPQEISKLVEYHINSFNARKSHYSLRDNPNKKYLPAELTVSKMHEMFLNDFQINLPYKAYWSVFQMFNIHFGYPKSDTCPFCDSFEQKLKTTLTVEENNQTQLEKTIHLKKAEAFLIEKKKYILKAKQGRVLMLSFDFMQNLPLPHIKTSTVFYSRQLWYNVFGIHNLGDDSVSMYRYCEHEGRKGANEVTSMLLDYLNSIPNDCNDLVLVSDGCPGQNKNKTMVQFLYCLVHILKLFTRVTYIFPVRGHTYMPNDQDFSLIGIKKKSLEAAELPNVWDDLIINARKKPNPFSLRIMKHNDFKDITSATGPFFLKTPKPPLKLKQVRMLQIEENSNTIKLKNSYYGPWQTHIVRSKVPLKLYLEIPLLYKSNPGINPSKKKDLQNLMPYLSEPASRAFYNNIISGDQPDSKVNDGNEVDIDDNSSGCED